MKPALSSAHKQPPVTLLQSSRSTDHSELPIDTSPLLDESFSSGAAADRKATPSRSALSLYREVKDVVRESFALVRDADPSVVPIRICLSLGQALQYGAYGWLTARVIPAVRDSNIYDMKILAPLLTAFAIKAGLEQLQRYVDNTQSLHQLKIENYIQARLRAIAPKSLEHMNRKDIAQDYRVVHGGGIWAFVSANATLIQGIGTAGSMLMAIGISSMYAPPIVTLALVGNAAFQLFKTVQLTNLLLDHEERLSIKRSKASQLGWQRIWPNFSQLFRGIGITGIIDQKVAEQRAAIIAAEKEVVQKKLLYDTISTGLTGVTAAGGFIALLGAIKSPSNPLTPENAVYVGLSMIPIFLTSLDQIGKSVVDMIKAKPTLEALRRLQESRSQEEDGQSTSIDWSRSDGAPIKVSNLHFAYPSSDPELRPVPIISGLNLTIADGEFVAVVGDNGAGKSTLVQLLSRSYRPLVGSVQIHERDIRETTDESLFMGVKSLPQNVLQIDGYTIREFLGWGRQAAGLEEDHVLLGRILDKVGVSSLLDTVLTLQGGEQVREFPDGLDTKLGAQDGGKNLSGGQLSLLYIAYMLYSNAKILCFDEPEKAIAEPRQDEFFQTLANMEELLGYRPTVILVTHKLKSVPLASKVLFMNKGGEGRSEFGTHEELLVSNPAYQRFFSRYRKTQPEPTPGQTT